MQLSIILALSLLSKLAHAWTVDLPYLSVAPVENLTNSSGTALNKPILAYYSIPFAAAPVDELRFAYPVPPVQNATILNNADYGPVCPQGPSVTLQSEDCLTLSVFRPQNSQDQKLPVVIWVPGGSFNTGGGSGLNLPSMIGNAPEGQDFIGVSINYRIGALGFLGGSVAAESGLTNLGLADQVMAFNWVQKYISYFGGDPDKVTLFGQSAGAHSVGTHLQHVDPGYKRPFSRVIMDSGGPTARVWAEPTYSLYQNQTNIFLNATGCNGKATASDTYACLRALPLDIIRNNSFELYSVNNGPLTWPFQPVVDGKYVARAPTESWNEGLFNKVPVLTGFNTNDGSVFAPRNLNTTAEFRAYMANLLPLANSTILDTIESLYPDPVTNSGSPFNTTAPGYSVQFQRIAAAIGDYSYISTVRKTALTVSQNSQSANPIYKYRFDHALPTADAALGVTHSAELQFVTKVIAGATSDLMNAYYTSFIITGDPNALTAAGSPYWSSYQPTQEQQLHFQQDGGAEMEIDDQRTEQIQFWLSIPDVYPH